MTSAPNEDELTDDALTGRFRVYQRRGGHRYSIDDVVVAWEAALARPGARRVLDLGCGLGSVLLMLADRLPDARLVGIEAQDISFDLATRNVARNGVGDRVALVRGDFREEGVVPRERFDLVTGTPPYQPPGTATPSPDAQRTYARIEMRGGVEAYLRAAAGALDEEGVLVVCADARRPERVLETAPAIGLHVVRRRDVVPREGARGPLFTVWTLVREPSERPLETTIFIPRDAAGERTKESLALRAFFELEGEGE